MSASSCRACLTSFDRANAVLVAAPEGAGQGLLCAATGSSEAGMAPEKTVLGPPSGADTGQHGCGHGLQGMPKHLSL